MFSASTKSGKNSGSTPDPQFNYVTMLLHGDGTNGAQNNTFLDSSTNAFSITRNGNTTQGSFSPYGSNWSNYFNGSSALNCGTIASLGTSNFTIECYCFPTSTTSYRYFLAIGPDTNFATGLFASAYTPYLYSSAFILTSSISCTENQWNHVAFVRNSGTLTVYVNGVSGGSVSFTTSISSGTGFVGQNSGGVYRFNGNISNLRLTNTAVYTSAFTPSTTPLTAISGTALLTCQSNRFIDNSTNNNTITPDGTPSVQRFNPFGTSTAYSTSVIGGSGYFDTGGDDYLSLGTATALGTGNVTVEFWFYPTNISATYYALYDGRSSAGTNTGFGVFQYGQTIEIYGNGLKVSSASSAFTANTWNHFAVVRTSGTCQIYINGVASGSSASYSDDLTSTTRTIARNATAGNYFAGYISNLREVTSALYSGTFTPSTTPLTAISGTSLLLNYTNGAIYDNAMMSDLETVGNAQISTSVVKYGTGSLAFDGTGDYLYRPNSDLFAFGTGDFTVEFWMYANSTATDKTLMGTASGYTTGGWQVGFNIDGQQANGIEFLIEASPHVYVFSGALSTATWYHVAATRSGTTLRLFINGTQVSSTTSSNNISDSAGNALAVGRTIEGIGSRDYNGYIDDLRITKGYARYTSNFTPPTAAFPNTGPV
jgi:hypothetical protein